jgi:hypothetical protein
MAYVRSDSSGNIIVINSDVRGSVFEYSLDVNVAKYDSSGDVVWFKYVSEGSPPIDPQSIEYDVRGLSFDSSNNIYILIRFLAYDTPSENKWLIVKLNPNGGLLWARKLTNLIYKNSTNYDSIRVQNNYIVLNGSYNVVGSLFELSAAKLPTDGSGTGTYGDFTYEVHEVVVQDSTYYGAIVSTSEPSSTYLELFENTYNLVELDVDDYQKTITQVS